MGVTIQKQNEFNGWKNDVSIYYEQVERIIKEETVALQKVVKQVAQTAINTLKDERAKLIESRTSLFNKLKETTDEISHDGDFLLPIPKVDVNDYKKKFEEMQKYLNDFDAIKAIKVEEDEAMEHLPLIDPSSIIQADSTHEVSIHSQWAAASGKFAVRMQDPTVERILSQFSMHTRRNAFAKDLKSFKESSIPVEKGAKVLTVYQNSYYRAKIVDIKPETERCRVQIVDYGNLEGRNYDEIWPYTEDALGFSEPVQMIECALSEEVMADPKSPKYTDARWTFNRHVQKYMQDTAGKGVFLATFRKKVNYKEDSAWLIDLEVEQDGCKLSLSDIVREKMGDGPDKSNICRDIRYAPDEIQTHIVKTKSEADESGESSQSQEQVAPPEADAITTAAMAAVNSILQGVVDLSVPPPPLSLPTSDGDGNTGKSLEINACSATAMEVKVVNRPMFAGDELKGCAAADEASKIVLSDGQSAVNRMNATSQSGDAAEVKLAVDSVISEAGSVHTAPQSFQQMSPRASEFLQKFTMGAVLKKANNTQPNPSSQKNSAPSDVD